jgi:hypothetical protein
MDGNIQDTGDAVKQIEINECVEDKGLAEYADIVYITADEAVFHRTEGGILALSFKGKEFGRVSVNRAFPFSLGDEFLSIRDSEGKEIGMIRNLADFPDNVKELIKEELEWVGNISAVVLEQYEMAGRTNMKKKHINLAVFIVMICVIAMAWYFNLTVLHKEAALMALGSDSAGISLVRIEWVLRDTANYNEPHYGAFALIAGIFVLPVQHIPSSLAMQFRFEEHYYVLPTSESQH